MERLNDEAGDGSIMDYETPAAMAYPSRDNPAGVWQALKPLVLNRRDLKRRRVMLQPDASSAQAALDIMRTRVARTMLHNNWKSLAITSPTPGCGKTTLAANLAFALARLDKYRVVLLDLDLRRPAMARLLGVIPNHSIDTMMRGRVSVRDGLMRHDDNLAIALASRPVADAAELLQSPLSAGVFKGLIRQLEPDVVIIDLPPMLASDDVAAFLPIVDAALLVVEAGVSSVAEIDLCERELSRQTNFAGLVLNKCRHTADKYGY